MSESSPVKSTRPIESAIIKRSDLRAFFEALGPGIITGAADDDPSGIATYSIAGARFGTSLLWTSLFTWPLIGVVQNMCARIGMVTGGGLAQALGKKFPRWVLVGVTGALLTANTINVAADLAGMADAAEMITGWNSHIFVVVFGTGIAAATVYWSYDRIANTLKWLTLFLFAYIITAFTVRIDWRAALHDSLVPLVTKSSNSVATVVAILGTTISPYLFFWQASLEVEEDKAKGKRTRRARLGASEAHLKHRRFDVGIGTLFSNCIMFFVILVTATTLHAHGVANIESAEDAARALEPFAGRFASVVYAMGLLGVGALAIPTLTGSVAYSMAETFQWRQGLGEDFRSAKSFYAAVVLTTLAGVALDFSTIRPMTALFWSAVVNGVLAPVLLFGIIIVARDDKLMQGQPSSHMSLAIVAVTALLMTGACIGMFVL